MMWTDNMRHADNALSHATGYMSSTYDQTCYGDVVQVLAGIGKKSMRDNNDGRK